MAVQQETYSTSKLTATQMKNGKGLIRNKDLMAIVDLGASKDVMHDSVVTPSKTHPSYYDINRLIVILIKRDMHSVHIAITYCSYM